MGGVVGSESRVIYHDEHDLAFDVQPFIVVPVILRRHDAVTGGIGGEIEPRPRREAERRHAVGETECGGDGNRAR